VFERWEDAFPDLHVEAVDLQAGLNAGEAAMSNYAAVVARAVDGLPRPVALCGWSMGGLAVLMAARQAGAERLVVLEPSPPGEVQGFDESIPLETGTFDPEEAYGPFPPGVPARPESRLARSERKRGVSVATVPCPALVVYGDELAEERGRAVARLYAAAERSFSGLDHWDLVRESRVATAVAHWLAGGKPVRNAE
jgi:pimeloyl-ACP methyl ester carboxylesterase